MGCLVSCVGACIGHPKGNPTGSTPTSFQAAWPLRWGGVPGAQTLKRVQLLAKPRPSSQSLDVRVPEALPTWAVVSPSRRRPAQPQSRRNHTQWAYKGQGQAPAPLGPQVPGRYYETLSAAQGAPGRSRSFEHSCQELRYSLRLQSEHTGPRVRPTEPQPSYLRLGEGTFLGSSPPPCPASEDRDLGGPLGTGEAPQENVLQATGRSWGIAH